MSKFDIATEMNNIMASPAYSIFAKPGAQFTKTAAKKDDDKAKADKEKAEKEKAKAKEKADKEKAKAKADKEKAKAKKKAMTKYESCVSSLCKASEILDEAGLSKASALTLIALDSLISTAAKKKEEAKKGKKDDKKEDKKDKKDKADAKGKKEDKKVKKAADGECEDCGDMAMVEDENDNKEFEALMKELEEGGEEGDWAVLDEKLPETEEDLDLDDPEITSLVESLENSQVDEDADPFAVVASKKKSSLQKLAEELSKSFLG